MKPYIFTLGLLCSFLNIHTLYSQIPDWQWAWRFGGNRVDEIQNQFIDSEDNIYVAGVTKSPGILIGNQTYNASNNVPMSFVAKFSPNGQLLWHFPFSGNVQGVEIKCLINNLPLVTASYHGTVNFGGFILTNSGSFNRTAWLKFNAIGGITSATEPTLLNQAGAYVTSVVPDQHHRLVFLGYSQNAANINGIAIEANKKYIGLLSQQGELLALRYLGGESTYDVNTGNFVDFVEYLQLSVGPSGRIYMGGEVCKTSTINTSTWTLPEIDYTNQLDWGRETFIACFDSTLNFEWSVLGDIQSNSEVPVGTCDFRGFYVFPDESIAMGISASLNQMSLIAFGNVNSPSPSTLNSNEDAYVVKLDAQGNTQWIRRFDNNFGTINGINSVTGDALGNFYFHSYALEGLNTDGSIYGNALITKLNSDGDVVWHRGSDNGPATPMIFYIYSMNMDTRGNLVISGSYSCFNAPFPIFGNTTLNWTTPVFEEPNAGDGFIAKLNTCPLIELSHNLVEPYSFCSGDSLNIQLAGSPMVLWSDGDTTLSKWITHADTLQVIGYDSLGCYSKFDTLVFSTRPSYRIENTARICYGDSLIIEGTAYTQAGSIEQIFTSSLGCDSILTTILQVDTVLAEISSSENVFTALNPPINATFQWLNCDANYSSITGALNPQFTAAVDGNYALEITSENCRDTSECLLFSSVGIAPNEMKDFNLYPNPNEGVLFIESSDLNQTIQIFDSQGKLVYEVLKNSIRFEIDTRRFIRGVYCVRCGKESQSLIILN